jgi:hypothetical protein
MPKIEPVFGLVAVIAVLLMALVLVNPSSNEVRSSTTTVSGNTETNPATTSIYSNTGSSVTSSGSGAGSGAFSLLMTDPPTVPSGVTNLFMVYDDVGVHLAGQGNSSGWTILSESGTVDLMQDVNVSQTIATAGLQSGVRFNALGFNITSVTVTFNNGSAAANYTAYLAYGHTRFFVPIPGGIVVNSSEDQAVMLDMTPKVLLLGSVRNPTFAFLPNARGLIVPHGAVSAGSHPFLGQRVSLESNPWWKSVLANTSFSISSAVLSGNTLSITAHNTGKDSIVFHFAAVTAQSSLSGGEMPIPAVSDIFIVEPNATLAQLNVTSNAVFDAQLESSGYLLAPGASITLTYSGSVAFGMQSYYEIQQGITVPVVPSDNYTVRLFGDGFVASAAATAIA